jgi:hypothetical protein
VTDDALRVEIDGDGVEPDTVDARVVLELASAYLEMLAGISSEPLTFRGLAIENKCMAVASRPSSLNVAEAAAREAAAYLAHQIDPDPMVREMLRRVRSATRALPDGQRAKAMVGQWEHAIESVDTPLDLLPRAVTSLRANVLRVGGIRPRAMFRSGSEEGTFSLDVTIEAVRTLAVHLYRDVDIVATVVRAPDGRIRGGVLEELTVVEEGDARGAWAAWLQASAPEWSDVRDIDALLRDSDEDVG